MRSCARRTRGCKLKRRLLREKVDALIHRIFGAQSEKLDRAQLLLMLQGFDEPPKSPEPVAAEAPRRSRAASPPRLRDAVRASQSTAIVNRIRAALRRIRPRHLPQSAMGRAITCALDQWPALQRFLGDGRIEIDNNLVENAIRPTALGKKNWLFIGAADAGQRGAVLHTIVQSCRRRGLDPLAYLRDVLIRLPKMTTGQIPEVPPAAWAKAQRQPPELKVAS